MEEILSQFEKLAKELAAREEIQLLSFYIAPPALGSEIERYQNLIGREFSSELLEYYSLCNGIQLRWIRKDNPDYSVEEFGKFHAGDVPYSDILDDSGRIEGAIYLLPISETFGNRGRYYEESQIDLNKTIMLDGNEISYMDFEAKVFPFDVYHHGMNTGLFIEDAAISILHGLGACHFLSKASSVADYLQLVLANFGFTRSRLLNYRHSYKGEYLKRTVNTELRLIETSIIPIEEMRLS